MIRKTLSLIFFACAAFFALVYYDRYFKWRDCFNDLGRCYDPETASVYVEQAGMVWGIMFFLMIIPALILWFRKSKPKN